MSEFNGVTQPINVMLDINLKSRILENREKLSPIVNTIKLCGNLGLSLRIILFWPGRKLYRVTKLLRSGDTKLEEYL